MAKKRKKEKMIALDGSILTWGNFIELLDKSGTDLDNLMLINMPNPSQTGTMAQRKRQDRYAHWNDSRSRSLISLVSDYESTKYSLVQS